MHVSVEKLEGLKRRMIVELPREEVEQEIEQKLKTFAKTLRINGFRPGKVPIKMVRSRYGAKIQEEVFDELMKSSFEDAVNESQINLVGTPQIEKTMELKAGDQNFAYVVSVEVIPELPTVSITDYTVEVPAVTITDTDVDNMMESIRSQHKNWQPVTGTVQQNHRVTLAYTSESAKSQDSEIASQIDCILGEDNAIHPIIANGIIGMSIGETRTFELPPDENRPEPQKVDITVETISEGILPELNADFMTQFDVTDGDIEAFKANIREGMEIKLDQKIKSLVGPQVMDILLAAYKIELPTTLVDQQKEKLRNDIAQSTTQKLEIDKKLLEDLAVRQVALRIIMDGLAAKHDIVLDTERVQQTVDSLVSGYENKQEALEYCSEERATIENVVMEEQIVDLVLDEVTIVDKPMSFDEIMTM